MKLTATHTLTTVLTSLFTTLLTHRDCAATLAVLREEALRIVPQASETPTLAKQMPLHDSVLRETLRLHPSFDDAMLREVVTPGGLTTPDGFFLPRGSHVAMHTRLMQRSNWSGDGQDWDTFEPFRFCNMASGRQSTQSNGETSNPSGDDATEQEKATALPNDKGQISAVQISDRYLPFGLGKHAW